MKNEKMRNSNKVILTILIVVLLILVGGQLIPRVIMSISPAPARLTTADSREFAQSAITAARDLTGNPLESAMQMGLQVTTLQKINDATGCGMVGGISYSGRYTAVIRAYTWFGIPYAEIDVDCNGATIHRFPWFTR